MSLSVVLILVLAGCSSEERVDQPDIGDVMPVLPLPPDSRTIGSAGSEDALQISFVSSLSRDEMADFYRGLFVGEPWTLISDTEAPDGAVVLYAENEGVPLWVRIIRTAGAAGSTIQLSGALVARNPVPVDSAGTEPTSE